MCDTLYKSFPNNESIFAKNSDRDPLEPQVTEIAIPSLILQRPYLNPLRQDYININVPVLKQAFFDLSPQYDAIISRPTWIWGAEMGVNEKGVAIGNEAVFSFTRLEKNGLLGMDILRLTLHSAASAKEATEIITFLIQKYGQGGNCAFRGKLTYHNSFLIADTMEAFVLETAGKKVAVKHINNFYSISNIYTIGSDYDHSNFEKKVNFKQKYQAGIYNIFTRGNVRRKYTMAQLEKLQKPYDIRHILRSHIKSEEPRPTMASICMHSPRHIKSETTASLIVHYKNNKFLIWTTLSPNPCVSIYKPITFDFARSTDLLKPDKNIELFTTRRRVTKKLLSDSTLKKQFLAAQQELEHTCLERLTSWETTGDKDLNTIITQCWDQEQEIINRLA